MDPLASKSPGQNPYAGFNNNPILFIDPDGMDGIVSVTITENGTTIITLSTTVHVSGAQVSDQQVQYLQDKFDEIESPFRLDPSETGGREVIVNIDVTYRNANSDLPKDQFKSRETGIISGAYLSEETKQKMGWRNGDNNLLIDKDPWATFRSGALNMSIGAGFARILGDGRQVNPTWVGGAESYGNDVAAQEVMHMLGFDERYHYGWGVHQGFEGDVMATGGAYYIHAQHYYDIYNYVLENGLLEDGATKWLTRVYNSSEPAFDDTQIGEQEVSSKFNPDGTKKE